MKRRMPEIFLLSYTLITLVGCTQLVLGTKPPADRRVQLVEGSPQTGTWRASEFVLSYEYLFTPAKENGLGMLEFSAFIDKTAFRLDSLSVWLYLLDADGKVVALKRLYASGYKDPAYMEEALARRLTFMVPAPPETVAISYDYSASVWSGGR